MKKYFDIVTVILIFKFLTFSLKLERPDKMFSVYKVEGRQFWT